MLWDRDGNEYIDAMASLWYCNVGHGRSEIADAVASQMRELETYSCFDPFTNPMAEAITKRVSDLSPIDHARVFLCGSGSESIDTAMKLARLAHVQAGHPERTLIISRMRGYHGTNYGGTTAQGLPPNKEGWGPLVPEVVQVPSDDIEALASLMSERSHEVAAVLSEPVQGAGGVWPAEEGYLQSLRKLCDQHGALLIFDEVITGFGRLGEWFGSIHYGVTPDIITFAKAVTSGYQPLGGVIVGPAVSGPLESDPNYVLKTGYTYSGHASVAAAGMVNLDIIGAKTFSRTPTESVNASRLVSARCRQMARLQKFAELVLCGPQECAQISTQWKSETTSSPKESSCAQSQIIRVPSARHSSLPTLRLTEWLMQCRRSLPHSERTN